MENKRRNRKDNCAKKEGIFSKIFADTGGNPEEIEDQDWYLDSPDVRLTRIFSVVLCLHIVAVGGILAFKMINKAARPGSSTLAKTSVVLREEPPAQKEFAGKVSTSPPPAVTIPSVAKGGNRQDRYCVIPGDTLSGIAAKLGVSTQQLKMTNHIQSPDEIIPGMWLKKPVPVVLDPTKNVSYETLPSDPVEVVNTAKKQANSKGRSYEVQKGDTAWGISRKFGVHHSVLLKHNGIARPELLQAGQVILIPEK